MNVAGDFQPLIDSAILHDKYVVASMSATTWSRQMRQIPKLEFNDSHLSFPSQTTINRKNKLNRDHINSTEQLYIQLTMDVYAN